jgi:hypothetical protein
MDGGRPLVHSFGKAANLFIAVWWSWLNLPGRLPSYIFSARTLLEL